MVFYGDEEMANGRTRVKSKGCRRREREREWLEDLVIRRFATHTSLLWGVCKLSGWLFSFLSWIRRQELQRRIKSHYSTQGEADVCKWEREGEREQEETKEQSVTTEICIGLHCKGESNAIHKYTLILPPYPGRFFYVCTGNNESENDNQTCTFIPYHAYLRILIGCSVDDNYLLEYWIAKRASERRNEKKGEKKWKKSGGMQKALMIFRALTACHLHDDNGQL